MKKQILKGVRRVGTGAKRVIQGEAVDSRFFMRNFFVTAFVVIVGMLFIGARFEYATTAQTIRTLERQIDIENTKKQYEISRYHTLTRESALKRLVDSLHLGLDTPEADPESRATELRYCD